MRAATHELSISPTRLPYGKVEVGLTRTIHVTVTNNGHASVKISGIDSSNRKFELSKLKLPKILAAGARLRVSVIFAPTAKGWEEGHITVISDASDRTLSVEAAGTGVIGEVIASPASLSFGKVGVGESSTLPVVLINTRPRRVTLKSVQITGRAFSVSGATFPLTLAAGQRVRLNAAFKPEVDGLTDGSLSISGPALRVPLTGTGTSASRPHLAMIPGTLSFGNVSVGTTRDTDAWVARQRWKRDHLVIIQQQFTVCGTRRCVPIDHPGGGGIVAQRYLHSAEQDREQVR